MYPLSACEVTSVPTNTPGIGHKKGLRGSGLIAVAGEAGSFGQNSGTVREGHLVKTVKQ